MRKGKNVYKRKDGRWEARVLIGHTAGGQPRYKYLYAHSYRDVLQKREGFEKNAVCQPPRTLCRDTLCFRDILPLWGELPLQDLGQDDHDRLMAQSRGRLRSSSLDIINTVLKGIVQYSLSDRHLDQVPFDHSHSSTKGTGGRMDILSAEEIESMAPYINLHLTPMTLGILPALCQGIRPGELCALQWEDIDVQKGVLHIRKTLQRIQNPSPKPGGPKTILYLGMPKNGRERSIPLHPAVSGILRNDPRGCPGRYYVIRDHRPMEPRSFSRHFKAILKQAGIRDLNLHTLRHTFSSCCVEAGMDIKALSEILGHSSVKITMDRYVHLSMRYKQSQLENLKIPFFPDTERQENGHA